MLRAPAAALPEHGGSTFAPSARVMSPVVYMLCGFVVGRRDPDQRCLWSAVRGARGDHRQPTVADELDELRAGHDRGRILSAAHRGR
jgi:hypothetical protein